MKDELRELVRDINDLSCGTLKAYDENCEQCAAGGRCGCGKWYGALIQSYCDKQIDSVTTFEFSGHKISKITDPNALKAFGPVFQADPGDGEPIKHGTLQELMEQIMEETVDYFYKAIDGYKKQNQELREIAEKVVELHKLAQSANIDNAVLAGEYRAKRYDAIEALSDYLTKNP